MNLPFTRDQFLGVFQEYNLSVWPMQIVLVLLGLTAIYVAVVRRPSSNTIIAAILSFLWIWMGAVYHVRYFTAINPAAYVFGVLFVIQGVVFLVSGLFRNSLSMEFRSDLFGIIGALLILYALIAYPILGYFQGHIYPQSPTFGLPCPTTIFTFAILLWSDRKVPVYVLVVPFLWSLIGSTAAVSLGMLEDAGLLVAGLCGTALIAVHNRRERRDALDAAY